MPLTLTGSRLSTYFDVPVAPSLENCDPNIEWNSNFVFSKSWSLYGVKSPAFQVILFNINRVLVGRARGQQAETACFVFCCNNQRVWLRLALTAGPRVPRATVCSRSAVISPFRGTSLWKRWHLWHLSANFRLHCRFNRSVLWGCARWLKLSSTSQTVDHRVWFWC